MLPSSDNNERITTSNLLKDKSLKIFKELHPTLNVNVNLDKVTYGSNKFLWWICQVCKEAYQTSPKQRGRGVAHTECNRKLHGLKRRWTTEQFIKRAIEIWGPNLFDYSKVVYVDMRTPVIIICKTCGSENSQEPHNHLRGFGCYPCSRRITGLKNRSNTAEFKEKAHGVHGTTYGYDGVDYTTNTTPVNIFCYACNAYFPQTPSDHLSGCGCQRCGIKKRSLALRKTFEQFLQDATDVHTDLYDYSDSEYITNKDDMKVYCKQCHKHFMVTPNNHLRGHGCRDCGIFWRGMRKRKTNEKFLEEAHSVFGPDAYDYSKTDYLRHDEPVTIGCKRCKKDFSQTLENHLRGQDGCPNCRRPTVESHGIRSIKRYLTEKGMTFWCERHLPHLPRRRYDIAFIYKGRYYIIEFDGRQHFRFTPIWHLDFDDFLFRQEVDKLKNAVALYSQYNIIRLSKPDYADVAATLDYFLSLSQETTYLGVDSMDYDYMLAPFNAELLLQRIPDSREIINTAVTVNASNFVHLYLPSVVATSLPLPEDPVSVEIDA